MTEEEPAWRAELRKALGEAAEWGISAWDAEVPGAEGALHDVVANATLAAIGPHIQAAEQRGREAALREAADCLMKRYGVTNRAAGDLHLMAMEHLINRGKS